MLPDALGPWWPGCGGASPLHTQAALKGHGRYDLCAGTRRGPLVTDGRTHASTTPLQTAPLPPGSLRVVDLGFFSLAVLAGIAAAGSFFLSPLHHTTVLLSPTGQRVRLLRGGCRRRYGVRTLLPAGSCANNTGGRGPAGARTAGRDTWPPPHGPPPPW